MDIHFKNFLLKLSLLICGLGICHECSCRSGYIKDGTKCYQFSTTAVPWEQADRSCKDDNASLIKMDEPNVFKLVQSIMTDRQRDIWVGAKRQANSKIIQWLDGVNVSRFWNNDEPDNVHQECVAAKYFKYPASLNDRPCETKRSFVCEGLCRSDYTSHGAICYKCFSDKVSWQEAARQCTGDNSTLIKIDNTVKLSLLQSIANDRFGLGQEQNKRQFQWIDGAIVNQFWKDGEPNDYGGDEDCVDIVIGFPGLLNDEPCTLSFPFVCEETSAQLTTQRVTRQETPQDKSDTTLLGVKIAVPLAVGGLLITVVTAVVCIHLKRRRRQAPTYDDTATAENPAEPEHCYLTNIGNVSDEYATIE